MALDKHIQPEGFGGARFPELKYRFPLDEKSKFNYDSIKQAIDDLGKISKYDLNSTEELNAYAQFVLGKDGKKLTDYSAEAVENTRDGLANRSTGILLNHGIKHAKDLASLVDEGMLLNSTLMQTPLFKTGEKKYDTVVAAREYLHSLYALLGKDPESAKKRNKYFNDRFGGLSDYSKQFFAGIEDEILGHDIHKAKNTAIKGLGEYGLTRFAADNIKHAARLSEEEVKANANLQQKRTKARDSRYAELNREYFTASEEAAFNESFADESRAISEKYRVVSKVLPAMILGNDKIPGIIQMAIVSQEAKKAA